MSHVSRSIRLATVVALVLSLSACASSPYRLGRGLEGPNTLALGPEEPQIVRGRPNAVLDTLGNVVSIPSKILLLNAHVENHDVSEETEAAIREYLAANDLHNVKVRLNQYAPGDEWRRLVNNRDVSPVWRFSVGTLTWLFYTLLPGRVFGGDHYNPFTNSIHLYSDVRAIALHEGGHAKDFAGKRWKGLQSTLRILPIVPLVQEAVATGDAIGYEREHGEVADERDAYEILYPAYGTYVAGEIGRFITGPAWLPYAIQGAVVLPAHVIGRIKSWWTGRAASRMPAPQATTGAEFTPIP